MSYQVLARKYRPQTFDEVIGQEPIVTTLQNAVEQKRIHHAYLFSGLRGVGKTTVARLMAKALNCAKGPTPRPCNACASCAEIAESRSLDVLEIDGASNRGIDAIRELRETVRYAPARDRYKVFIIDEVHMLTKEAWNALLKTLEEPPAQVVFVFATTEYRQIPLTILSRCQHFEFKKIATSALLTHLKAVAEGEKVEVEARALDLICRLAEGSLRDAQSALDQVIAFSGSKLTTEQARTILGVIDHELISGFFAGVRERDCARLVRIVETVFEKGYQPVKFLEDLMAHARDLLLARVLKEPGPHIAGDAEEIAALVASAQLFSEDEMLRMLELMTREEQRLKHTAHPRYLLEALAIKMARLADLKSIEDLVARLDADPPHEGPDGPDRSVPRARTAVAAPEHDAAPGGNRAAGGDAALVEKILQKVHDESGPLGGCLSHADWVEIAGDTLRIAFPEKHGFFREKVEAREALEYLKGVARHVTGRPLAVSVVATSPEVRDRREAAADTPERRSQDLREQAMKEPAVRGLLDAFGGEIVDIESV